MTAVLVTGGNRGIGLEVVRQLARAGWTAHLGSRDAAQGDAAAAALVAEGLDVRSVSLDVNERRSIERAIGSIGALDVVVNNAAIHYDTTNLASAPDFRVVAEALQTNLLGAWQVGVASLPLLRASDHPRIVNVSSGGGSLAEMGPGLAAYGISKAGLNVLTRKWAQELRRDRILVNSVCPGWVATDMGGVGGRPVADGARGVVWAATLPDDGPTGGFFRDGEPIPW